MEVLIEHKNKEGYWVGHTSNYLKIELKSEKELKNNIVNVKIVLMIT